MEFDFMDLTEAKKLIAGYLTDSFVPREQLEEACKVANTDPEYIRYLVDELGLHGEWVSECDIFQSNLAEFSEMSEEEQRSEMKDNQEHMMECDMCRRAYWDLKTSWIQALETDTGGTKIKLPDPIILYRSDLGLHESKQGPPPVAQEIVAIAAEKIPVEEAAAEAVAEEGRKYHAWRREDPETGCVIGIFTSWLPDGKVSLRVEIECEGDESFDMETYQIEVYDAYNDVLMVAGRLQDFLEKGIELVAGLWRVRLFSGDRPEADAWELRLQIKGGASSTL